MRQHRLLKCRELFHAFDVVRVVFRVVVAVPLVHSPTLLLLFVALIHEIFHVFQTEHAWIFKELFRAIASARFLPTLRANALVFIVIRDVFVLGLVERVLLLLLFLLLFLLLLFLFLLLLLLIFLLLLSPTSTTTFYTFFLTTINKNVLMSLVHLINLCNF